MKFELSIYFGLNCALFVCLVSQFHKSRGYIKFLLSFPYHRACDQFIHALCFKYILLFDSDIFGNKCLLSFGLIPGHQTQGLACIKDVIYYMNHNLEPFKYTLKHVSGTGISRFNYSSKKTMIFLSRRSRKICTIIILPTCSLLPWHRNKWFSKEKNF